jgi:predicted ATPase
MYIQKAEIKNIRSIVDFEIEFKKPAGWHVLIGDNGAGKTTIIRSMALALIGLPQAQGLRANWDDWVKRYENNGNIKLYLSESVNSAMYESELKFTELDKPRLSGGLRVTPQPTGMLLNWEPAQTVSISGNGWSNTFGSFSVAFGSYRRFDSGNEQWKKIFENPSFASLAAHLSVFGEDIAFTEVISWLKYLDYQSLEENKGSRHTLESINKLINHKDNDESFLPHNTTLENVNSEGVFLKDGNGIIMSVNQMSDGYRSALSLLFELIRQFVRVYGAEKVFKNFEEGKMEIDLPGVVLVDEIDAHLHPTWQTRIGQWFLKYFPKLQFIVTTHSPLVCRAAENGSIWRLAAPGSDEKSGEITGDERNRLIYGNVLDATEVFGPGLTISEKSIEKQEELVKLSKMKMAGVINGKDEEKLTKLRRTFTTNDPIDL